MIHIALCTDNFYIIPCLACITSIFEHNKENDIKVYILTKGLSDINQTYIRRISNQYKKEIELITIHQDAFKGFKISTRFRESIYYRLLIPDLINADKVLYIDSDTIVLRNLKDLWDTNISEYSCGVVEDQAADDIRILNRIETDSTYFNSGVLLINALYWRKHQIGQKVSECIYQHPDKCVYPDQDALNIILNKKVYYLSYKYNYQEKFYLSNWSGLFINRKKWEKIKDEKDNAVIIHYTDNIKPWYKECTHPLQFHFIHFANLVKPDKFKLKSYYSFKQKIIILVKNSLSTKRKQSSC